MTYRFGTGTLITEVMRERLPLSPIVNIAVLPFMSGEVMVQHYNTALSLNRLAQVTLWLDPGTQDRVNCFLRVPMRYFSSTTLRWPKCARLSILSPPRTS